MANGGAEFCALQTRTSQLARKKSLLSTGQEINCQYSHICRGIYCLLTQTPQTRTVYLTQTGTTDIPSGLERFYSRLSRWFGAKVKSG